MKKAIKVIGLVSVAFAAGITAELYASWSITSSASRFFEAASSGNYADARALAARSFEGGVSGEGFEAFLESEGMSDIVSSAWKEQSVWGGRGSLEGSLSTKGGAVIPVRVSLLKEEGTWKISAIEKALAGSSGLGNPQVPAARELAALVQESMRAFALSVSSKDFGTFYEHISPLWQSQASPALLEGLFQEFVDDGINLLPLQELQPVFDMPPALDSAGVLALKGHYPSRPASVSFELRYYKDAASWRLVGAAINAKQG